MLYIATIFQREGVKTQKDPFFFIWFLDHSRSHLLTFHFDSWILGAAAAAGRALEGELFTMSLSTPKNGNAQHLRVVSVVPVRSEYQPVIEYVRELNGLMRDS